MFKYFHFTALPKSQHVADYYYFYLARMKNLQGSSIRNMSQCYKSLNQGSMIDCMQKEFGMLLKNCKLGYSHWRKL